MTAVIPLAEQPVYHSRTEQWCHRIGLISLLLYAFTWQLSLDISRSFEPVLMLVYLIALIMHPRRGAALRDPLWWLLGVWVLLQLVNIPAAQARFPDYAEAQIKDMRHLSKLFLILPAAWALAGRTRNALWLVTALFAGMMLGALLMGERLELITMIQNGERPRLGFKNWQHAGVCLGVILIGMSCFASRFIDWSSQALRAPALRWSLRLGYVAVAALVLFGMLITKTRASWLALMVVIVIAMSAALWTLARGRFATRQARAKLGGSLACAAVLCIVAGALYGDAIVGRMLAEQQVIDNMLAGNLQDIGYSSIGFRLHAWHYALSLIAEQPWFGWGPQSHIPLLLNAPNPELQAVATRSNLTHFHNSYITLLVANGVLGLAVFAAVAGVIGVAAWRGWRRGDIPGDMMAFLSLFFVFWLIVNCFESYVGYRTGIYLDALIGGIAYSYAMRRRLQARPALHTASP